MIHAKPRFALSATAIAVAILGGLTATEASADVHGQCQNCGRFVVISKTGAGLNRAWKGLCGHCYLKQDQGWFDINEHRYVSFQDGTLIDMKHFRGSMILSYLGSSVMHSPIRGILFANAVGWTIEMIQYHNGHPSGHPFGGNEDLLSNFSGSLAAHNVFSVIIGGNWAQQSVPFLELLHGHITSVTDTKKER